MKLNNITYGTFNMIFDALSCNMAVNLLFKYFCCFFFKMMVEENLYYCEPHQIGNDVTEPKLDLSLSTALYQLSSGISYFFKLIIEN